MPFSRVHRRLTAWLALSAMLLGAVSPAVAQVLVAFSSDRIQWVEVCSASGMVWVKADAGSVANAPQAGNEGQRPVDHAASTHCPWCRLHGSEAAPPSATPVCQALPRQTDAPRTGYHAVTPADTWLPLQARAPPRCA